MHGSRVSFSLAPSRRRSSVSLPSLRPLRYEALALTELALEEAGEDAAAGLRELADAVPSVTTLISEAARAAGDPAQRPTAAPQAPLRLCVAIDAIDCSLRTRN